MNFLIVPPFNSLQRRGGGLTEIARPNDAIEPKKRGRIECPGRARLVSCGMKRSYGQRQRAGPNEAKSVRELRCYRRARPLHIYPHRNVFSADRSVQPSLPDLGESIPMVPAHPRYTLFRARVAHSSDSRPSAVRRTLTRRRIVVFDAHGRSFSDRGLHGLQ